MVKKWFKPKHISGFSKEKTIDENFKTMMSNADKRLSKENKILRVGKQAQALSNVNKDIKTKGKAKAVADRAFRRLG